MIHFIYTSAQSPYETLLYAEVQYDRALIEGSTSTQVKISYEGNALKDYFCSVYDDDILIGDAVTDENGIADIELSQSIEIDDNIILKIRDLNFYERLFSIDCITNNEPCVYIDRLVINDSLGNNNNLIEYEETIFLDVVLKNFGAMPTSDLNAAVTSCSLDYFSIEDNWEDIESIDGLSELIVPHAFKLRINKNIPNDYLITLNLTCDDYDHYWYSFADMRVNAPELEFVGFNYDDSMGNDNGIIEKGETIIMNVEIRNICDLNLDNVSVSMTSDDNYLDFEEIIREIDFIESGSNAEIEFIFNVKDDIPELSRTSLNVSATIHSYTFDIVEDIKIGCWMEGFETGDFSKLDWSFADDADWFITNEDSYEGNFSARSASVDYGEMSSMGFYVQMTEADSICFYVKRVMEDKEASLSFYVDGLSMESWSGEGGWERCSVILPEGVHYVEWVYLPGISSSSEDYSLIDNIELPYHSIIYDDVNEQDETMADIFVFPNPNNGSFYVDMPNAECYDVQIFNVLGSKMLEYNALRGRCLLGEEGLLPGIYIVKIFDELNVCSRKILVR